MLDILGVTDVVDGVDREDVVFIAGTEDTGVEEPIPMTDAVWFNALDVLDGVDRVDVVFIAGAYETGVDVSILITDAA